jgi:curved DNA-binding protein CbpA
LNKNLIYIVDPADSNGKRLTSTFKMADSAPGSASDMASNLDSCYRIIGLPTSASFGEVRKTYIRMAKRLHPDKNGNAEEFKELNAAYVAIANKAKDADHTEMAEDMCAYFSSSTENMKSVTLKVPVEALSVWHAVLQEEYGPPKTQGPKGDKYVASVSLQDEDADSPLLGSAHVTVYHTGTILVQGASYLLWHAGYFPDILKKVCIKQKAQPAPLGIASYQAQQGAVHTETVQPSDADTPPASPLTHTADDAAELSEASATSVADDACRGVHNHGNKDADWSTDQISVRLDALEQHFINTVDRLHKENQALNLSVRDIQLQHLKQEINKIEKDRDNIQQAKTKLEKENCALQVVNERLRAECNTVRSDEKLKSQTSTIERLRAENADQLKSNKTYMEIKKSLESELKTTQNAKVVALLEIERLQKRLASRELHIHSTEDALKLAETDLVNAKEEIGELHRQVKTVMEEGVSGFQTVTRNRQHAGKPNHPAVPAASDTSTHTLVDTEPSVDVAILTATPSPKTTITPTTPSARAKSEGTFSKPPVAHRNRGDHLVITSSIGRDLDYRRILPGSQDRVFVKPMSGGKIENATKYLEKTEYSYKSITILMGGNNISGGDSTEICLNKFCDLFKLIDARHANTRINICEIPPRPAEPIRNKLASLNHGIKELCTASASRSWVPVNIDSSGKYFVDDRLHLSHVGTAQLALDIRHAIDPTRPPSRSLAEDDTRSPRRATINSSTDYSSRGDQQNHYSGRRHYSVAQRETNNMGAPDHDLVFRLKLISDLVNLQTDFPFLGDSSRQGHHRGGHRDSRVNRD